MEKKRVLVIDDALFMRSLIKDVLMSKCGLDVCGEADNAPLGVEKYKSLKPDLVTLDIIMPKMEEIDGVIAVREIIAADPQAKIIVISALSDNRMVQQALVYGAKEFVIKPFSANKLVEAIQRVLG